MSGSGCLSSPSSVRRCRGHRYTTPRAKAGQRPLHTLLKKYPTALSGSAHLNNGGRCFPAAGAEEELAARHGRAPGLRGENRPRSKAPGLPGASGGVTRACFAADRIAMAVPASRAPHGFQVVEFPTWTPPLLPRLTSLLPWTLQVSSAAAERGARTPVEGD